MPVANRSVLCNAAVAKVGRIDRQAAVDRELAYCISNRMPDRQLRVTAGALTCLATLLGTFRLLDK